MGAAAAMATRFGENSADPAKVCTGRGRAGPAAAVLRWGRHRRARRGVQVRGQSVYLQYSLRQEITGTRGGGDAPSNVLIVAVENLEVRLPGSLERNCGPTLMSEPAFAAPLHRTHHNPLTASCLVLPRAGQRAVHHRHAAPGVQRIWFCAQDSHL